MYTDNSLNSHTKTHTTFWMAQRELAEWIHTNSHTKPHRMYPYMWSQKTPHSVSCLVAIMGWLWLVRSIKLQVSFAKEPYERDDILHKTPIILSILLAEATPHVNCLFTKKTHWMAQRELAEWIHTNSHTKTHRMYPYMWSQNSLNCTKGTLACCTGWRRLIGSPKMQVIFHKRATKYRSLLRKMTYKDKGP